MESIAQTNPRDYEIINELLSRVRVELDSLNSL
jgi:hypothetical protein